VLRAASVAIALTCAGTAVAHGVKEGDIRAGHAWAPPPSDGDAMVFVPLVNEGGTGRELVRVSTPAAQGSALRRGTGSDAERLERLHIDAGGMVNLARWREHIHLTGVAGDLADGDRFPLTLHFAEHPPVTLDVVVETQPGH